MRHRAHLPAKERQARSRLAKLLHEQPFLIGSLVSMDRVCGKPGCKCTRGELHPGLYLALRVGTKRKMIHVPQSLESSGPPMGRNLSGGLAVDGADLPSLSEAIWKGQRAVPGETEMMRRFCHYVSKVFDFGRGFLSLPTGGRDPVCRREPFGGVSFFSL